MSLSCSNLPSVTLTNGVKIIKQYAFNWSSLDSVYFPESVIKIEGGAFAGCSQLSRLVMDASNPVFDSRDNCNAIVRTATNTLFMGCKESIIPSSVTHIGDSAFYGCSGLNSIDIPSSVTSIGKYAFAGCSSLSSIDISNAVISIGNWTFANCTGLSSITIPGSVTSIGSETFTNCSDLTSIVVEAGNTVYDSRDNCNAIIRTATNEIVRGCQSTVIPSSVTTIGYMAFSHCGGLTTLTIPALPARRIVVVR